MNAKKISMPFLFEFFSLVNEQCSIANTNQRITNTGALGIKNNFALNPRPSVSVEDESNCILRTEYKDERS